MYACACVSVCFSEYLRVCVYVCVWERERERVWVVVCEEESKVAREEMGGRVEQKERLLKKFSWARVKQFFSSYTEHEKLFFWRPSSSVWISASKRTQGGENFGNQRREAKHYFFSADARLVVLRNWIGFENKKNKNAKNNKTSSSFNEEEWRNCFWDR